MYNMIELNTLCYLLLLLLPLLYVFFKYIKSPSNLPPGPFKWPVIGNILNLGSAPHISLTQLAASYGPLISLRVGTQLVVVASTPSAATEILKTHDRVFSARSPLHSLPVSPDRLHLSIPAADCTAQWKYLRMLIQTELFAAKVIESQAKVREDKVNQLVEFLHSKEGKVVNIGGVAFATVCNILSNIFVSKDLMNLEEECEDVGMNKVMKKYVEVLSSPNLADLYNIFRGLDLQGLNKKAKVIAAQFSGLWEPIIEKRREEKGSSISRQRDFLDSLIDQGVSYDQINNLFLELFTAGAETSTSVIEWAMAELIKQPEILKRVGIELAKETSGGVVRESDLPRLPYLQSVVKETLRLHPAVPLLIPHRAIETCEVMGYTIPKDTQVWVNSWAIGRDPVAWEEPHAFKPERFLESSVTLSSNSFDFIPFGGGRRMCPGLPMVAKQIPLILASFINCFHWSLPESLPKELEMDNQFGRILAKEKPLLLLPTAKTQ